MSELFVSYVPVDIELFNTPICRKNLTIFTEYKQTRKIRLQWLFVSTIHVEEMQ